MIRDETTTKKKKKKRKRETVLLETGGICEQCEPRLID